jgi:hypothetical protein
MDELSADSEALINDFEEIKINSNQRQSTNDQNGRISSNFRGTNKLSHHFSSFSKLYFNGFFF